MSDEKAIKGRCSSGLPAVLWGSAGYGAAVLEGGSLHSLAFCAIGLIGRLPVVVFASMGLLFFSWVWVWLGPVAC